MKQLNKYNMKNLVIILGLMVMMFSCKKEKLTPTPAPTPAPIVSTDTCNCVTWDLNKILDLKWYYNPVGTSNGDSCFVEFKSDGTFNWRSSTVVALDDKKLKYHSGTWKFSKNKVDNHNNPITCRIEIHFSDVLFHDANWYFQVTTLFDSPFRLMMTESNIQANYVYHTIP